MVDIAILMTCHNRKETTLKCLRAIFDQQLPIDINLQIYLVDDGSTDGTSSAVEQNFNSVKIIQGNGSLFWNGGMRLAFKEAAKTGHDYHLWLNDDTILKQNAIMDLLNTSKQIKKKHQKEGIVVGSICDPENNVFTYGGVVCNGFKPLSFKNVTPTGFLSPCHTMNGNCVLIHKHVFKEIGNLDKHFTHAMGDTDYGLRAKRKGYPLYVSNNYVGFCKRNYPPKWTIPTVSLKERWSDINNPKGLPPKEWLYFLKRHSGKWFIYYFIMYYIRIILPQLWLPPKNK